MLEIRSSQESKRRSPGYLNTLTRIAAVAGIVLGAQAVEASDGTQTNPDGTVPCQSAEVMAPQRISTLEDTENIQYTLDGCSADAKAYLLATYIGNPNTKDDDFIAFQIPIGKPYRSVASCVIPSQDPNAPACGPMWQFGRSKNGAYDLTIFSVSGDGKNSTNLWGARVNDQLTTYSTNLPSVSTSE